MIVLSAIFSILSGLFILHLWVKCPDVVHSMFTCGAVMKPQSAFCFVMSGVLMLFAEDALNKKRFISQLAVSISSMWILFVMFILAWGQLLDEVGGVTLFYAQSYDKEFIRQVGYPSWGTIVAFTSLGATGLLCLLDNSWFRFSVRFAGSLIIVLAATAALGHLFEWSPAYYKLANVSSGMSLLSAVLFSCLGVSCLLITHNFYHAKSQS